MTIMLIISYNNFVNHSLVYKFSFGKIKIKEVVIEYLHFYCSIWSYTNIYKLFCPMFKYILVIAIIILLK